MPAPVGMTDARKIILPIPEQVPQSQNIQHLEVAIDTTAAWGADHTELQLRRGTYQKVARPTFIRQAQEVRSKFKGQSQDARTSNLIVLSQILPGWVEGHYWAEVYYCPEAATMLLPQPKNVARPKIRPLGGS